MGRQVGIGAAIAAIAVRQGGVVGRPQLRALGLSDGAIEKRVRAGHLHRVHRGVFAVGHPLLGSLGRRWAAVLASGSGAVLSDAAAAHAYGVRHSAPALIDVTVAVSGRRAQPGIRLHCRRLAADERTEFDGLPITSGARTLLDLAAGGLRGGLRGLRFTYHQATRRRAYVVGAIATALASELSPLGNDNSETAGAQRP
jgi:hypothetical protein